MTKEQGKWVRYSEAFCAAMRPDRPQLIEQYLQAWARPCREVRDSSRQGLLHVAAVHGGSRLAAHLVARGCPVDQRNRLGETPLVTALKHGNCRVAEALVRLGADPLRKNRRGEGPLHFCRHLHYKEVVERLVGRVRAAGGRRAVARAVLEADCPPHVAVFAGDVELVRAVVARRGDVDEADEFGHTALHAAILRDDVAAARLLLGLGASRAGMLVWAARQGLADEHGTSYLEMLRLLLEHGAEPNELDPGRRSALHVAAKCGNEAAVRLLLDRGAELAAEDAAGKGVLHFAAKNYDWGILAMLADDPRLDVNATNARGQTPLHAACRWSNLSCIKLLLERGAKVNVVDDSRYSPLYALVESSYELMLERQETLDTVELLLEHGADVDVPSPDGSSILLEALDNNLDDVLVRHLARAEQLGRPIGQPHLRLIRATPKLAEYLRRCRRELRAMRSAKLFGRVSFFDMLTCDQRAMLGYARNRELVVALGHSKYSKKFPLYCDKLRRNFDRGMRRHKQTTAAIAKLEGTLLFGLPEVTEKILHYLSGDDLNNINRC